MNQRAFRRLGEAVDHARCHWRVTAAVVCLAIATALTSLTIPGVLLLHKTQERPTPVTRVVRLPAATVLPTLSPSPKITPTFSKGTSPPQNATSTALARSAATSSCAGARFYPYMNADGAPQTGDTVHVTATLMNLGGSTCWLPSCTARVSVRDPGGRTTLLTSQSLCTRPPFAMRAGGRYSVVAAFVVSVAGSYSVRFDWPPLAGVTGLVFIFSPSPHPTPIGTSPLPNPTPSPS